MNLQEIKKAIEDGKRVFWKASNYEVIKGQVTGDLYIQCSNNKHCIGLTWQDGTTLNGDEKDFYSVNCMTYLLKELNKSLRIAVDTRDKKSINILYNEVDGINFDDVSEDTAQEYDELVSEANDILYGLSRLN